MRVISRLATGLFVVVVALCLLVCYRCINLQSTVTLVIFNLFFVSLFFQLNGSMPLKALMLTVGNILGLVWNMLFYYLSAAGALYFGAASNALFALIYPILNLMWIVPFWSLSLSFLPKLHFSERLEGKV